MEVAMVYFSQYCTKFCKKFVSWKQRENTEFVLAKFVHKTPTHTVSVSKYRWSQSYCVTCFFLYTHLCVKKNASSPRQLPSKKSMRGCGLAVKDWSEKQTDSCFQFEIRKQYVNIVISRKAKRRVTPLLKRTHFLKTFRLDIAWSCYKR